MEFRVLGNLEVYDGSEPVSLVPRLRLLLAILLTRRRETVSTDFLIDALWSESPPNNARALLHVRISELRRSLSHGVPTADSGIKTHTSGYVLQVAPDQVDCDKFEHLIANGRATMAREDHLGAYDILGEALALWRGAPFREFEDQTFAQAQISRLTDLYLQAHEDRFSASLAIGKHKEVLAAVPQIVNEHPLREGLWFMLMLAQYRAGRQGEALETYRKVTSLLSESLGVDPGRELQQLYLQVLQQDPALDPPAAAAPPRKLQNLPTPITHFIGRAWELNEIRAMLGEHRLVTLLGSGGTGKSRLAIEVTKNATANFPGGVWFAELPPLRHSEIVIQTIAKSLGLTEHPALSLEEVVQDFLGQGKMLLVLDNCEHLVDEVAGLVHRLLQACPDLTILVTSQERLGIPGEALRVIQGMTLAGSDFLDTFSMMQYDAIQLMVERASAVRPGFRLDKTNLEAIAQICRRLDGLPLAIELAAALVSVIDVSQIAQRLDDRFELLQRSLRDPLARHQTLRAAVDWSYGLLTPSEQQLFKKVSVFVGGFSLEAAEAVCAQEGSESVVITLTRLVDKSLVLSDDAAGVGRRYKLLDSLRIFGLDQLNSSGDLTPMRESHTFYYLGVAQEAAARLRSYEQELWLHRLELEHDNMRAALEWSIGAGDYETAAGIAGSLYPFWDLHGHYGEGRRWLRQILQSGKAISSQARIKVLLGDATLAVIQGDLDSAGIDCQEAASLARLIGDRASLAHALQYLGLSLMYSREYAAAEEALGESLENAIAARDTWLESWAYVFLASVALSRGHLGRARRLAYQFLATPDSHHDTEAVGWINLCLGATEWYDGDRTTAVRPLTRGFSIFKELGGLWGLSIGIFLSAQLAGARGDVGQQVLLMSASEHLRTSVGVKLLPFQQNWLADASKDCHNFLGQDTFNRHWQEGESLPFDSACVLAGREFELAARSLALPE